MHTCSTNPTHSTKPQLGVIVHSGLARIHPRAQGKRIISDTPPTNHLPSSFLSNLNTAHSPFPLLPSAVIRGFSSSRILTSSPCSLEVRRQSCDGIGAFTQSQFTASSPTYPLAGPVYPSSFAYSTPLESCSTGAYRIGTEVSSRCSSTRRSARSSYPIWYVQSLLPLVVPFKYPSLFRFPMAVHCF